MLIINTDLGPDPAGKITIVRPVIRAPLHRPARPPLVCTVQTRKDLSSNSWMRVTASAIHGRGGYAARFIPGGTRIIEYTGERITKAEAVRREAARLRRLKRGGDGSVYIFNLNQRYDLDGRTRRNPARLINHSCTPNCQAETIHGRIWIVARRDIEAGEELTFDYGFPLKEWSLHPCRCGAPRCAGYIVNAWQRKRLRRILREHRKAVGAPHRSAKPRGIG